MTGARAERRVAVLVVCHNRRERTLRALRSLADAPWPLEIVLFDDGSSDGTADAVKRLYPRATVLEGAGDSFWNGGLHQAWAAALRMPVDCFLWLNDDVELDAGALARLEEAFQRLDTARAGRSFILVGATRGEDGGVSYGGLRCERSPLALRFRLAGQSDGLQPVATFNGNIVLVPRQVAERIGLNDPAFFHNMGDLDYGLRASAAGVAVLQVPGTLGLCPANRSKSAGPFEGRSFRERWARMNSHLGLPLRSWWRLTRRHSGPWFALHFLLPYRRLFRASGPAEEQALG